MSAAPHPSGSAAPQTRLAAAWQRALRAEQRAVFGYSLLGARLRASSHVRLAISCSDAHDALRDRTVAVITASGWRPDAPAADYPGLYPVSDTAAALELAVAVEQGCAQAWRALYASAAGDAGSRSAAGEARRVAQQALQDSAVRAARWRRIIDPARSTDAFPGLPTR